MVQQPAAGASTSGMPSSAHTRSLSIASRSWLSGGDDMVRQPKLPASPQAAAISCMTRSRSPSRGVDTMIGLVVRREHRRELGEVVRSGGASSGRAIDMTKSMLGEVLAERGAGGDVGEARPAPGSPESGSST